MEYDDKNRGVLFREAEKKTEKSPDFTGTVNVEGKEFRLAGWERVSKNGKKFLSLAVSEPKPRETPTWEQTREKFAARKEDNLPKDEDVDQPIDLSEIPF